MGHEFIGIVEDTGADVRTVKPGALVIAPFAWSDSTCDYCREGLQTSCRHGGFWNANGVGVGQAEAVRVPLADGTLVATPIGEDSPLIPSLLTLSDVYGTGCHAAVKARVTPRTTVTVIGDGAVGLMAVLSARRLGAERIILMGRHTSRTELGREFGATDVVAERGDDGIAKVRDLTGGDGTHVVIEAVGHMPVKSLARTSPLHAHASVARNRGGDHAARVDPSGRAPNGLYLQHTRPSRPAGHVPVRAGTGSMFHRTARDRVDVPLIRPEQGPDRERVHRKRPGMPEITFRMSIANARA
jgi:threonine dehydrogenase-like Zn-dependent dehydrogenase